MKLSIILPVLNEAAYIQQTLNGLQPLRHQGHEIIIVDGGSRDGTLERVAGLADSVLVSRAGRALQMNAGAEVSSGNVLLFLHADTVLPVTVLTAIHKAVQGAKQWGRFDVRLSGQSSVFRLIALMMNWRSCLTSIATGDQAMFVTRDLFFDCGGFPEIELMEDIAMSKRLRAHGRAACIKDTVTTSSRRWEQHGVLRTMVLMWRLRLLYFLGVSPAKLARQYRQS